MRLFEKFKMYLYDADTNSYYEKNFRLYTPVKVIIIILIVYFVILVVKKLIGI